MISNDLFKYYTGIKVVVGGKDYASVDEKRVRELAEMSAKDVKLGKKTRDKKEFKNESEYKIYLMGLVQGAWNERSGETPSYVVNE